MNQNKTWFWVYWSGGLAASFSVILGKFITVSLSALVHKLGLLMDIVCVCSENILSDEGKTRCPGPDT